MTMASSSGRGDASIQSRVWLLETPLQVVLDRLTALATKVLHVPVALVTFIEADRQIIRSRSVHAGPLTDVYETPLSHSLCQQVTATREALIIADTREDPRTCDSPAIADLNVVAYAGVPFFDGQDRPLGAFCAIDHEAHFWQDREIDVLHMLAAQVMSEIVLRDALETCGSGIVVPDERSRQADRPNVQAPLQAMLAGLRAVRQFGQINEEQSECLALVERDGQTLAAIVGKRLDDGVIQYEGQEA